VALPVFEPFALPDITFQPNRQIHHLSRSAFCSLSSPLHVFSRTPVLLKPRVGKPAAKRPPNRLVFH
jgi:hypothetical protein